MHTRPPRFRTLFAAVAVTVALLAGPAFGQDRPVNAAEFAAPGDAPPTELPLVRAVMFSSGVGYFEHAGTVTDDATVRLVFQREQINDVLKSLIVMDAGGGTVTRASYATRDPLERTLASFAIDLSKQPTLPELLKQLRGSMVTLHAPNAVTGRILSVEKRTRVVNDTRLDEHLVTLATDDGLRTFRLEDVERVQLDDPDLQSELTKALTTLADERDVDRRPVDLRFEGEGEREVRVGYLIETPVWKTSYRLDLTRTGHLSDPSTATGPDADANDNNEALLQGWAIAENMTESDWQDVTLSLVSGQPISFRQDLYTPLYVDRPEVKLPSHAHLTPRLHGEGLAVGEDVQQLAAQRRAGVAGRPQFAAEAEADALQQLTTHRARALDAQQLAESVEARAEAGAVGELFHYTLDHPVTLPRRRSAMLPIVADHIDAERLSIYNLREDQGHPRAGVAITNTTDLKLLAGPVTVLDGNMYAGDAILDHTEPGDTRLLSYAVDLSVNVDTSASSAQRIAAARIVRGVLHATHRHEFTQTYRLRNRDDKPRTLVIEHPFDRRRELVDPEEPYERTSEWYRFRVPLDSDTTGEFTVIEERIDRQTIAILDQPIARFMVYARSGRVSEDVRDALEQIAEMRHAIGELEERLAERQRELREIERAQGRLRQNIEAVGRDSQLGQRYLRTLSDQEDRIETLESEIADLRERIEQARAQLADHLRNLNIE